MKVSNTVILYVNELDYFDTYLCDFTTQSAHYTGCNTMIKQNESVLYKTTY